MSDVDAVDRVLSPVLEAAGELARSASQVGEEARGGQDAAAIPAAQLAVARLRGQARDLLARLDETGTRLSMLEEAAQLVVHGDRFVLPPMEEGERRQEEF